MQSRDRGCEGEGVFNFGIMMNWLQWSLHTLKRVFPCGPYREAPWTLVKCEVSYSRCRCSIRFLTACRRYGVIPNCVRNCSQTSKLFGDRLLECERKFHEKVLTKLIEEKFRCLNHRRLQREAAVRRVYAWMSASSATWSVRHSRIMASFVAEAESQKLSRKLEALLCKRGSVSNPTAQDPAAPLVSVERQNRRVVIENSVADAVPELARQLMALGPKFVPRRSVTDRLVKTAELGVERLAFGTRWKVESERRLRVRNEEEIGAAAKEDDGERPSDRPLDKDVRLRKMTVTSMQGPWMETTEENALRRLKENVIKLYNQARHDRFNNLDGRRLTKKERDSLAEVRADSRIVVKPSDKSKGFLVMSRTSYEEKVSAMVGCPASYERCAITVQELEKQVKAIVLPIVEGQVPAKLASAVIPSNCRMSQFYGLQKTTRKDFRCALWCRHAVPRRATYPWYWSAFSTRCCALSLLIWPVRSTV